LTVLVLTGCGIVHDVRKVAHAVEGNKSTIDSFTKDLQSSGSATFEATYVTTGSAPATIVYAAKPPDGIAFSDTPSGSNAPSANLIANSSGEYSCSPPSAPGAHWTCEQLGTADVATQNQIFDLYTPAHWVGFLKGLSIAAGLAGDSVTSSSMTVNGFALQCIDLKATGVAGTSTICSTSQGILGYVSVASDATSFEIKSYSATPPDSLFALPPGATVTKPPSTTT
jgi:hypothetical protein